MSRPRTLTPSTRVRRLTAPVTAGLLAVGALTALPAQQAHAAGSVVEVTGGQADWQLTVDGSPYQVKGLTWGPSPADAERYMPDLASMGVNTVRTWGTDASSRPLLDSAAAHGVKVIAGFWLQPGGGPGSGGCVDYLTDTAYKDEMLAEFPRWVQEYKDHPGVLMWNVGNESVLGLQNCYGGDDLERQRDAYTTFVNDVAKKIHAVDPNHPVTSTDAWVGAWPYYQKNAPDLDLYAVNAYDAVCDVRSAWEQGGYTKPYIVTESGPPGEWEVPDDANGVPEEPTDQAKAEGYTDAWNCVTGHRGVALGATLFHYGTEYDFGGIWFNLLPAGQKRLSYYAVKRAYGGDTSGDNTPPVVSGFGVEGGAGQVQAGKDLVLTARATDPDGDPVTYEVLANSNYIDQGKQLTTLPATDLGGGRLQVTAPDRPGVWKLYVKATDGKGNVGVETLSARVVPPAVDGTDVALGKPATASSFQTSYGDCPCPAANAVDGDPDTRWASDWSDPQWIQVDLGTRTAFRHVQLYWEASYARDYTVQTSDDGQNWQTVATVTDGNGGVDTLDAAGTGRYVRVNGTARGTGYGYSLYEFGVFS
ncbi:discoidin domain-containing protein [Streptomyces olivaceus]|uniref:discoidin domain-containing protein n=1 Tax=Streptomyces olivaceus TaxID=47716 RepID=UPI001CCBDD35|nr:discoidin domain-containing protein [Streptomyces olivaceus]MBZ6291351.1 discoidin domain-containing protein [Streptomyces olivaceus]MBZ6308868.1 discoidin domain-containing protein [Streptomyces olivaceus]MBZ6322892.1 discoidin domain-containing protein [Streptomyces olivaceus]MBZ6324907.1 discoidin domain-containing protein [Streptomyces olivaceus]